MNKKKLKYFIGIIYLEVVFAVLLLSFAGIICSVSLFWIGYHNVDLGQNIRYINAEYDLNLMDTLNNGTIVSGYEAYDLGTSQQQKAFYFFGIFMMAFLWSFIWFDGAVKEFKKYEKEYKDELL